MAVDDCWVCLFRVVFTPNKTPKEFAQPFYTKEGAIRFINDTERNYFSKGASSALWTIFPPGSDIDPSEWSLENAEKEHPWPWPKVKRTGTDADPIFGVSFNPDFDHITMSRKKSEAAKKAREKRKGMVKERGRYETKERNRSVLVGARKKKMK